MHNLTIRTAQYDVAPLNQTFQYFRSKPVIILTSHLFQLRFATKLVQSMVCCAAGEF